MSVEEKFDIETHDGQSGGPGRSGHPRPWSGVVKVIFGLVILLMLRPPSFTGASPLESRRRRRES